MEAPCWCTVEVHQHGGRKPVETSGILFGCLYHFLLYNELANILIDTSPSILANIGNVSYLRTYIYIRRRSLHDKT